MVKPYITEIRGSRELRFSLTAIQSCMDVTQPEVLMLEYTQLMMGFLLFQPAPTCLTMIGLGGGSLAKFCYSNLPITRIVAVEINPHVIALRKEFLVPPDDGRFKVIEGDGALYVRRPPQKTEVLLVDGFDATGIPQQLCSKRFYDNCYDALYPGGMLVANFHATHPQFPAYVERVRAAFAGRGSILVVEEKTSTNAVVFGYKSNAMTIPTKTSLNKACIGDVALKQLGPAFDAITRELENATL